MELIHITKELESPSKQKQFDRCRLLGQLQYIDHWEPRIAVRSLPARLRGSAFSRGAELIHRAIMEKETDLLNQTSFVFSVIETAVAFFDRQFDYCVQKGIQFAPEADALIRAELRRVIPLYAHHTPVRRWQKVTAVEQPIRMHSCRPDLTGVNEEGFDVVADNKYKSTIAAHYETSTIEEYHWDPQFLQYNHAHRIDIGCGPHHNVYSSLLMVIGSPFRIKEVNWLYTPEQLAMWYASALDMTRTIQDITAGRVLPRAATTHRDNFGWCPMKKACLELYLDPELMKLDYVQLDEMPE